MVMDLPLELVVSMFNDQVLANVIERGVFINLRSIVNLVWRFYFIIQGIITELLVMFLCLYEELFFPQIQNCAKD